MIAEEALIRIFRDIASADSNYSALSNGVFNMRAPAGIDWPYSTMMLEPGRPLRAQRTTLAYIIKVQLKHWAREAAGVEALQTAINLSSAAVKLYHARDDASLGTSMDAVYENLNGVAAGYGWEFTNAEISLTIPPYMDKINDYEAWCCGHIFEFWMEAV